MLCLYSSSHVASERSLCQVPAGDRTALDGQSGCWKTSTSSKWIVLYQTSRTQSWQSEIFYDHITPNIWLSNSSDCNPLDYHVWGVVEQKAIKTPSNTKDELKARIMAAFTNLNRRLLEMLAGDSKVIWRP